MYQAYLVDNHLILQTRQQVDRDRFELKLAGSYRLRDFRFVVPVDADNGPAVEKSRAGVGFLDEIEEVAEQRDCLDPGAVAQIERTLQSSKLAVNIGQHRDPIPETLADGYTSRARRGRSTLARWMVLTTGHDQTVDDQRALALVEHEQRVDVDLLDQIA